MDFSIRNVAVFGYSARAGWRALAVLWVQDADCLAFHRKMLTCFAMKYYCSNEGAPDGRY